MKIVIAITDINIFNTFYAIAEEKGIELVNGKVENKLFDIIASNKIDGFVIQNNLPFTKRAIEYIKKKHPYVPLIIYTANDDVINGGDIYMSFNNELDDTILFQLTLQNIKNFKTNFKKLKELFTKIEKSVEFGPCVYDPTLRTISYNGSKIKVSPKMGGLLQILAMNFGKVVNKDIILEAVWEKSGDYFASRSMDVYITNLRKLLKEKNIPLDIKNIQGRGLVIK
jgi:DNA-binding response OmpR family regulator